MAVYTRSLATLVAVLVAVGCLAANQDGADGGAPDEATTDDTSSESSSEPERCKLEADESNPRVTLTGRVCGEPVSLTTQAGTLIHLGRSQATDPETEIRAIEVAANVDPNTQLELASAQFLVNMSFETGPELGTPISTHNLVTGVFSLCGFGTVVMIPGPVTFEMSGVETDTPSGDITLTLSGLIVGGFSSQYGQNRVESCGGELELTLQGRFAHQ